MRLFVLKMASKELEEYMYIVVEVVDCNQKKIWAGSGGRVPGPNNGGRAG